jgi:hypothetical protein
MVHVITQDACARLGEKEKIVSFWIVLENQTVVTMEFA